MFDPWFGFAYKGSAAKIQVTIQQLSPTVLVQDLSPAAFIDANYDSWNYFSKNLSNVNFLASAWTTGVAIEWQVSSWNDSHAIPL